MTETLIPANVKIVIDSANLPTIVGQSAFDAWKSIPGNESGTVQDFIDDITGPAGPGGGSQVEDFQTIAPGFSTTSSSYVTTGLECSAVPSSVGDEFIIDCVGCAGNSGATNVNRFTLFRKIGAGSFVELTPSGDTSLAWTRTIDSGYADQWLFSFKDAPNTTDPVTYQLRMNVAAGTGYLGQRPDGTVMKSRTSMKVTKV